jgi:hypothetical protein
LSKISISQLCYIIRFVFFIFYKVITHRFVIRVIIKKILSERDKNPPPAEVEITTQLLINYTFNNQVLGFRRQNFIHVLEN